MNERNYSKMSAKQLRAEFELEKRNFKSCPKKGSFSGLAIAERCEKVQQEMNRRKMAFEPFYMDIDIEVG